MSVATSGPTGRVEHVEDAGRLAGCGFTHPSPVPGKRESIGSNACLRVRTVGIRAIVVGYWIPGEYRIRAGRQ